MSTLGTPFSSKAIKVMLLGSGELGKEVAIALQRLGCEVIAVDRYANAPAMQVAHRHHIVSMLDADALEAIIRQEKPNLIVPEIEAIATDMLMKLENEGFTVIPSAFATRTTMNRKGIRHLAATELGLNTSPFRFASSHKEYLEAIETVGLPCVVKPIMSSSGRGQSIIHHTNEVEGAWQHAQTAGRTGEGEVIVEGLVEFDYEITLLTVRHQGGTSFCAPIGHRQEKGDYRESWQPQPMNTVALEKAQAMAGKITEALGGRGVFGVEFFVKGDEVYFNEVSPRPHDTGLVTLISQNFSEFELHARAILGLPIPLIEQRGPSASSVVITEGKGDDISFSGLNQALSEVDTDVRLFGKPDIDGERRLGVVVAKADSIEAARAKAQRGSSAIKVSIQ